MQWLPTTFLEVPQYCTFCISPLSDTPNSGLGVSTNELMIWIRCVRSRWNGKYAVLGGPPGARLGTTTLMDFPSQCRAQHFLHRTQLCLREGRFKFSRVCVCNKWAGINMLMFYFDFTLKQLKINFKNDSFSWLWVDSFFWKIITLYTVHFKISDFAGFYHPLRAVLHTAWKIISKNT